MKQVLISTIILVIICSTNPPVVAQDVCEPDLAPIYNLLLAAESAWDAGDADAAVARLSEARHLLEQIERACPVTEQAQTPPAHPGATRIIVHVMEHYTTFGVAELTKFSAVAYVNGFSVTVYDDQAAFLTELDEPDVAAAIYGGQVASDPGLRKLYDFVQYGGRILLMYDGSWLERNAALQELFGVSLAAEKIDVQARSSFHYRPTLLPNWLDGYSVGIPSLSNDLIAHFNLYLVVPANWPGERGTLEGENASLRLLYYANPTGTVTFFPLPLGGAFQWTELFFNDENIDYFDNETAAVAILEYLLAD